MPPKDGSPKKARKKKAPTFYTTDEDLAPFGVKMNDIVRTPLGLTGTVIGVKYADINDKGAGKLWLEYPDGLQAPLEPSRSCGNIAALGYLLSSESDHIWRDVTKLRMEAEENETKRREAEERMRIRMEQLALELAAEAKKNAKKKKKPSDAAAGDAATADAPPPS
eukprot:jgi/Mesvir1/12932/Mv05950-RA.1